jgi:hypothetical protein
MMERFNQVMRDSVKKSIDQIVILVVIDSSYCERKCDNETQYSEERESPDAGDGYIVRAISVCPYRVYFK